MNEHTRETERAKYSQCYATETYHCQGARYARVIQDARSIPAGCTYLDVGCGRAEMVKIAADRGVRAMGLELVTELCGEFGGGDEARYEVMEGVVTELPFEDEWFDYVSCYDMLEHLPEDQVDGALDELFRVTGRRLWLTTNDKQSRLQLPGGDFLELHLTRKPRFWWDEKIFARAEARGMAVAATSYGNDEWHWEVGD